MRLDVTKYPYDYKRTMNTQTSLDIHPDLIQIFTSASIKHLHRIQWYRYTLMRLDMTKYPFNLDRMMNPLISIIHPGYLDFMSAQNLMIQAPMSLNMTKWASEHIKTTHAQISLRIHPDRSRPPMSGNIQHRIQQDMSPNMAKYHLDVQRQ